MHCEIVGKRIQLAAQPLTLSFLWTGKAQPPAGLSRWLSGDLQQLKGDLGLLSTLGPSFLQCSLHCSPHLSPGSHHFTG